MAMMTVREPFGSRFPKIALLIIAVAMLVAPIVSPSPSSDAKANQASGDTLKLYFWQAPTTLNPHLSAGTKDYSAARITYEPLASFDVDGNLVPFLAAEIPSLENGGVAADLTAVTWKLKPDVVWSDGEPFTADDVLFTYEYVTNSDVSSTSAPSYAGIDSVEVIDDHTVTVYFTESTFAWATPFVGVQGMIIPRHVYGDYMGANAGDAPGNLAPVGTGPYRVAEYKTEDILIIGEDAVATIKITYEANPYYREADALHFAAVELRGGGGDALIAAQLVISGEADYAWNVQLNDEILAQFDDAGVTYLQNFDPFVERIMINFTDPNRETETGERSSIAFPHPFLTDLLVRQAFAHAVDREAIAALYGVTGRPTTNLLVSPPILNSPNTANLYPFDLERAASLLDEAGWVDTDGDGIRDKDGVQLRVVFLTSITPNRQGAQEIVGNALASIGVAVEPKSVDSSVFLGPPEESTNTRRHFYADLEEFAFSNKSPDPAAYLKGWTCDEIAQEANNWSKSNWGRYCNPEYDALYAQAVAETDDEKRIELFIGLNDLLIRDVALIPLVDLAIIPTIDEHLTGLSITPWDVDLWNIAEWRLE
jgi:peptide/nickel transport system substrate-binding protein